MIIIGAELESIRTLKDKTLKLSFGTNELNPQEMFSLMESAGQFGYMAFKKEPFKQEEKKVIDELETSYDDGKKTPSQRLRSVLFLMWKKNPEGFDSSVRHYDHHMEKIINHYKTKLD